jgi:type IV pilus assembly protein PilA
MARPLLEAPAMASRSTARSARGFTLVELAVVVVIVGVLAVLAVMGYRKMMLSSKLTEATNMVGAYRIAQEDYKSERGVYFSGNAASWCPVGSGVGSAKVQWDPTCTGGLPVHSDGMVHFRYRTAGGASWGGTDPLSVSWFSFSGIPGGRPFYIVHAMCDLDSAGGLQTEVVGSSASNQIATHNDGQ